MERYKAHTGLGDPGFQDFYDQYPDRRTRDEDHAFRKFGGAWNFNEIVGFVRLYVLGSQIRGELWLPSPPADATPEHLRVRLTRDVVTSTRSPWYPWASLLWRVFHEDVVECPHCHQPMRVRAVVLAPATLRITASLDQSAARAPPAFDGDLPDHELALAT